VQRTRQQQTRHLQSPVQPPTLPAPNTHTSAAAHRRTANCPPLVERTRDCFSAFHHRRRSDRGALAARPRSTLRATTPSTAPHPHSTDPASLSHLLSLPNPSACPLNDELSPTPHPHPHPLTAPPPLPTLHYTTTARAPRRQPPACLRIRRCLSATQSTSDTTARPSRAHPQQPAAPATRAQTPPCLPHLGPLPASITRLRG
jgi:hypothetical protein